MSGERAILGEVLREAREAAGLTQQTVAGSARMDRAYLSMVERGLSSPTVERLLRICRAVGVKPSTVLLRVQDRLGGF